MSDPPASHACNRRDGFDGRLSGAIFLQLGILAPDINLEVGSASHAEQRAAIMTGYDRLLVAATSALCQG